MPPKGNHSNPAKFSHHGLALEQTIYARNLLYHPGFTFRKELGLASGVLYKITVTWSNELLKALGGRLFGSEGQLSGKSPSDLKNILWRVHQDGLVNTAKVNASDRSVVIALMGDIGALYADTGATTGVENRSPQQAQHIRETIRKSLGIKTNIMSQVVERVKNTGGSEAVGPTKKDNRSRSDNKPPRTGIHNTGRQADKIIKELVGILGKEIPPARWQVAFIDNVVLNDQFKHEPYAGHMSGSPAEILHIWDMLRDELPDNMYRTAPDVRDNQSRMNLRYARAAGASAFLVAGGYHSSMEVLEGVLAYTGQALRGTEKTIFGQDSKHDASHLFGDGASTALIGELHIAQTRPDKRLVRVDLVDRSGAYFG